MSGRIVRGKFRYYRCASWGNGTDPAVRCRGDLPLNDVEPKVWAAIVRVLEQPDVIAQEVHRQQTSAEEQRAEIERELAVIESALAEGGFQQV